MRKKKRLMLLVCRVKSIYPFVKSVNDSSSLISSKYTRYNVSSGQPRLAPCQWMKILWWFLRVRNPFHWHHKVQSRLQTSIPAQINQVKRERTVGVLQRQSQGNKEASTSLNVEAPEWKGCTLPTSTSHGETIEGGLLARHLDMSHKNVSNMVEVQRMQLLQNQRLQELLRQKQFQTLAITLPKPEIPVFSVDPVKYSDFLRAFEDLIES